MHTHAHENLARNGPQGPWSAVFSARVQGLGFRVWGLGFGVWGLGFRV